MKDKLLFTLIILSLIFLFLMIFKTNEITIKPNPLPTLIISQNALIAVVSPISPKYVVSGVMIDIIQCESGNQHYVNGKLKVGDKDLKYQAFGIAQFQRRTFNWLSKLSGNTSLKIESEQDQIWLLDFALRNGYGKLWSCYK